GQYAYLSPGLGIAGGNLERDLATVVSLANESGTDDGVVDAWIANSRYRRDWALRVIHAEAISKIENPRIAVWGLAYKQDTTSTKNSPALALVDALSPFEIRAYDPQVVLKDERGPKFLQVSSALEALSGADVLALMTPWREFSGTPVSEITGRMRGRLIVDPFAMLDEKACIKAGLSYFRLGSHVSRSSDK
ncbi:MAG: GDP-mannose dehydrogenase, partial [Acidobacteria bacterium]|nr:GDP-mannose dehydrogenase [Acidobacteriota bacterium]